MRAAAPTPPLDLKGFLDWEERQYHQGSGCFLCQVRDCLFAWQ